MVTKEELSMASFDFLRAIAGMVKTELRSCPTHNQESTWMVRTGPGRMTGQKFTRSIFDRRAISMIYQKHSFDPFPEQENLENLLAQAGIEIQAIRYGYTLPLIYWWLDAPNPFALNKQDLSIVLDGFNNAVLKGEVIVRSRDAIVGLKFISDQLVFEKDIHIRPIMEEELWEYGDTDNLGVRFGMSSWLRWLSEDWLILDISLPCKTLKVFPPNAIGQTRQAVFTALLLLASGSFQVYDLGCDLNYGVGAPGRVYSGEEIPRHYGLAGEAYTLDESMAERLKQSWPHIRRITQSEGHYLRLPAMRLLDGGSRLRPDDAIIDYAIGLEALLTAGTDKELGYRFALRGAMVLTWDKTSKKSDKAKVFRKLRDFYKARSGIVHGQIISKSKLDDFRSFGELALRDIWWWYFKKRDKGLTATVSAIDDRILT